MIIKVTTHNFDKTRKMLDDIINGTDDAIDDTLHQIGENIVYEAKSTVQNNQNINSGDLLSSIRIMDEGGHSITVGTDMSYAWYIEYGRGPVTAREGHYLHWIDKTTHKDVFAKRVKATEPQPFLEPEVIKQSLIFRDLYVDNSKNLIR